MLNPKDCRSVGQVRLRWISLAKKQSRPKGLPYISGGGNYA